VPTIIVAEFPPFDTDQFEGAEFHMFRGDAQLVVHVAEEPDVVVTFRRVRWHEFTALYNCSPEQISSSYFKLAEVESSRPLAKYVASDRASTKAYSELHHYRIFLDEHGCHEVFAQSAALEGRRALRSGQSPNTSLERTRER
jgi:hypothetical protein